MKYVGISLYKQKQGVMIIIMNMCLSSVYSLSIYTLCRSPS